MTRARAEVGPAARRDVDGHVLWWRTGAGAAAARRFAAAATVTFRGLARNPGLGSPVPVAGPGLAGPRKWRVDRFPNLLFLYHPVERGIRVLRVLRAARGRPALLNG